MGDTQLHTIEANGSQVTVAERGAVVTSWTVPGADGPIEILDGYRNDEELRDFAGYRGALLAPWSNRIRGGRYQYQGRDFECEVGADGKHEGLHGLAAKADFEVAARSASSISLRTDIAASAAYPEPLSVEVTYRVEQSLHAWQLHLTLTVTNRGEHAAPIGLGWHPYVRLQGPRSGARLVVPARTRVVTDEDLIPLPGEDAFAPCESFDQEGGKAVINLDEPLDTAFTELTLLPGDHPHSSAILEHADGSRTEMAAYMTLAPHRGVGIFHVFTGEGLPYRSGEAVALEYCQFMTDALNRDHLAHFLPVEPGTARVMDVAIHHTPAAFTGDEDPLSALRGEPIHSRLTH